MRQLPLPQKCKGRRLDSDLSIWAMVVTRPGYKAIVMGQDGLMDKASFLSKSFRYNRSYFPLPQSSYLKVEHGHSKLVAFILDI